MPSISTSTWSALVPRTYTEVVLPRSPLLEIEIPARPVRRSLTDCGCSRSMSARVMTVTEAIASATGSALRVAVTITWFRSETASCETQTKGQPAESSAATKKSLTCQLLHALHA